MTRRKHPPRDIRRGDGYITERTLSTGDTRYQARWHDGTRWRAKTFRVPGDAEDHLRDIGRAKRRREYVPDAEYTLLDVVDDYLERGKSRWRESTYHSYRAIRDIYLDGERVGGALARDLTPRMMQNWVDSLATLSRSRLAVICTVLSGALKEAMRLDAITRNPMDGVRLPRATKRQYTIWTRDELAAVIDVACDHPLMHPYYVTAVSTGMRPGELLALDWASVDMAIGAIHCTRTLSKDADGILRVGETTKTGVARRIPLPDIAVTILRTHRRAQAERRLAHPTWHDGNFVFERGNGRFLAPEMIRRLHRSMVDAAGVRWCRLHDLRHLAATLLLESGVDVKTVSQILGHTSVSVTLDLYAHVTDQMSRHAASVMDGILTRGSGA